jgi:hypothetical protein
MYIVIMYFSTVYVTLSLYTSLYFLIISYRLLYSCIQNIYRRPRSCLCNHGIYWHLLPLLYMVPFLSLFLNVLVYLLTLIMRGAYLLLITFIWSYWFLHVHVFTVLYQYTLSYCLSNCVLLCVLSYCIH